MAASVYGGAWRAHSHTLNGHTLVAEIRWMQMFTPDQALASCYQAHNLRFLNRFRVTTIEILDQGHINPQLEHPSQTCPRWGLNRRPSAPQAGTQAKSYSNSLQIWLFWFTDSASHLILVWSRRETFTGYSHCYKGQKFCTVPYRTVCFLSSICSECIHCGSSCQISPMLNCTLGYVGGPLPSYIGYPLIHGCASHYSRQQT